jgi:hypothetical protein
MGTRLLAEKPSSLAARLSAYWMTAPHLEDTNPPADEDGDNSNVVPITR